MIAVDTTHFHGVDELNITVEPRDEHDVLFATAGTFGAIMAVGPENLEVKSLKQVIRFKYAFTGGQPEDGVHFIMQAPSWRPYD